MFFRSEARDTRRTAKKQLKSLMEIASSHREQIRKRINETSELDKQLLQIVKETTEITGTLKEKLSSRLKITRNTLSSICQTMADGVILIDSSGNVIECNMMFEQMAGENKEQMVGKNFSEIFSMLNTVYTDTQEKFVCADRNFEKLSRLVYTKSICEDKDCESCQELVKCNDGVEKILSECTFSLSDPLHLTIKTKLGACLKTSMTFSVLENEPEKVEDVVFMLVVKLEI